jgi:hypothetical protein
MCGYLLIPALLAKQSKRPGLTSKSQCLGMMTAWEICNDQQREAYYSTGGDTASEELLGNTIAMWTQDMTEISNWDDSEKLAGIAFYYTDLSEKEIKQLFNTTRKEVHPRQPPWELTHPKQEIEAITIQRK